MRDFVRSSRLWVLVVLAAGILGWYWITDPAHGADTAIRLQAVAWGIVLAGLTYLIRRGLTGRVRSHDAANAGLRSPAGAGLVYLGVSIVTAAIFLGLCSLAHAAEPTPPPGAVPLLPVLHAQQRAFWPDMPDPPTLGAQVEQETCVSLTSRRCWSPYAELKTSREYGFGLGQITVTRRFDNFAAARGLDPSLRAWRWADRYDPARQLRVLVLMDRGLYWRIAGADTARDRLAFAFAAYNGGAGGVSSDRRVCVMTPGCDPGRWFGNVERTSLKARAAAAGYGQSFFSINRGYVRAILITRRPRYVAALGD